MIHLTNKFYPYNTDTENASVSVLLAAIVQLPRLLLYGYRDPYGYRGGLGTTDIEIPVDNQSSIRAKINIKYSPLLWVRQPFAPSRNPFSFLPTFSYWQKIGPSLGPLWSVPLSLTCPSYADLKKNGRTKMTSHPKYGWQLYCVYQLHKCKHFSFLFLKNLINVHRNEIHIYRAWCLILISKSLLDVQRIEKDFRFLLKLQSFVLC